VSDASGVDSEVFEFVGEFVILMGDVEEGLGRDTADVKAGPAQRSSLLDADSIQAELSCLDRGNITFLSKVVPPGPPPITARSKARFEKA
jgi:hypothetical protein